MNKRPRQVPQSQQYGGQANHGDVVGKTVGGSFPMILGIQQSIIVQGAMPNEQVSRKPKPHRALDLMKRKDE